MPKLPDTLRFSTNSPFYNMVASFNIAAAGSHSIFSLENEMGFEAMHTIKLDSIITKELHIRPFDLREKIKNGYISQNDYTGSICMMLINTDYETVKEKNDRSPEFEFFRHVRNASSHLNKFNFFPWEPKREASWRGIEIPINPKGAANPLYGNYCFGELLGISDALYLLWDIDQKINKNSN